MKILGIETSCDETAAAVVEDGTTILSNVIASSKELHEKTGGIIPEIAAREQLKCIIPVIEEALRQSIRYQVSGIRQMVKIHQPAVNNEQLFSTVDAIAVTVGPGLIGSLLVGVETAKTIAMVTGKPVIPVNHIFAHIYANFISSFLLVQDRNEVSSRARDSGRAPAFAGRSPNPSLLPAHASARRRPAVACQSDDSAQGHEISFPAIALVASGGHTELFLMEGHGKLQWLGGTMDDAAGEAFDKTARMIGLGYGGGTAIAAEAAKFQISNFKFQIPRLPRPMVHDETLNFSFSGLKTAVMREMKQLESTDDWNDTAKAALAYEIQEAITDVLVKKTLKAADQHSVSSILLGGGVTANQRLKEKMEFRIKDTQSEIRLHIPQPALCTDNAAVIASYAYFNNYPVDWRTIEAQPNLSVEVE